ncbi:DUF4282 domain-containing protein [Pseudomonadota bacterium DY0742]
MKQTLFFDAMVTPKIITLLYWLGLVGVVVGSIALMAGMFGGGLWSGLAVLVFGVIGTRVWCELLIVLFKIHENLQKVASKA